MYLCKNNISFYVAGVRQVLEGSGEQGKMEKTGWKIICGALPTLAVKGLMMIMMT